MGVNAEGEADEDPKAALKAAFRAKQAEREAKEGNKEEVKDADAEQASKEKEAEEAPKKPAAGKKRPADEGDVDAQEAKRKKALEEAKKAVLAKIYEVEKAAKEAAQADLLGDIDSSLNVADKNIVDFLREEAEAVVGEMLASKPKTKAVAVQREAVYERRDPRFTLTAQAKAAAAARAAGAKKNPAKAAATYTNMSWDPQRGASFAKAPAAPPEEKPPPAPAPAAPPPPQRRRGIHVDVNKPGFVMDNGAIPGLQKVQAGIRPGQGRFKAPSAVSKAEPMRKPPPPVG